MADAQKDLQAARRRGIAYRVFTERFGPITTKGQWTATPVELINAVLDIIDKAEKFELEEQLRRHIREQPGVPYGGGADALRADMAMSVPDTASVIEPEPKPVTYWHVHKTNLAKLQGTLNHHAREGWRLHHLYRANNGPTAEIACIFRREFPNEEAREAFVEERHRQWEEREHAKRVREFANPERDEVALSRRGIEINGKPVAQCTREEVETALRCCLEDLEQLRKGPF